MSEQWIEINKASEVLDINLEKLCDLVIKGMITTSTCDDQLMVDIATLPDIDESCALDNNRCIDTLKSELEKMKLESAWLKSENMMNKKLIEEYHAKFAELNAIKKELIEVINHQSETIRAMKGYNSVEKLDGNLECIKYPARKRSGSSIWMLLPMIGLATAAFVEICKVKNICNLDDLLHYIGLM